MERLTPRKLVPGDAIRVIAPARSLAMLDSATRAIADGRLQDLGLRVTFGRHAEESDAFTSASVQARIDDLHEAFADVRVAAAGDTLAAVDVQGGQPADSLVVPLSVARAVLCDESTMIAAGPPHAECVAAAKRDLRAGDMLDGIGGGTVYGLIETAERAARAGAVPVGLLRGGRMRRDAARGTVLTWEDVVLDDSLTIVHLRRLQDVMAQQGMF